jgi:colanic acid biosynthesis glycosyl transferase WcaI
MSRILMISMYYWPEESGNAPYSTGIAEHLVSSGHDVTVLTAMPHYPEWRIRRGYRAWRQTESRNGVRVDRRRHYVPSSQSALKRAAYEGSFFASALPFMPAKGIDAIIGVVPSLSGGALSRLTAARFRVRYGLIVQDLMGSAAEQSGISGGRRAAGVARQIEKWAVARAVAVAPVSDAFVPYLRSIGVNDDRMEVLANWTNLGPTTRLREETRAALGWGREEWIVLHAGNMGLKQGLEQVVRAARLADERAAPLRFVLMGDGSQRSAIQLLARDTRRLSLCPFVDSSELPNVLAAADVLFVSERESVVDMSLPSKLTSYFASGRPVIAAVHPNGATARELQRADAGLVTPAGNPEALLRALLHLRDSPIECQRLSANGATYAETHLTRTQALTRVDAFVERLARSARGARA